MRFVSVLLTDEQAELAAAACIDASQQEDLSEEDAAVIGRIAVMLQDAAENPAKYTPQGKQALVARTVVRRVKGDAQPKPLNKRKARQEQRMRTHKERRKLRRIITQGYNEARARIEAERAEAEEAQRELQERLAQQTRFNVVDVDGDVLMEGVPAEFVVNAETGENLLPKVIVP